MGPNSTDSALQNAPVSFFAQLIDRLPKQGILELFESKCPVHNARLCQRAPSLHRLRTVLQDASGLLSTVHDAKQAQQAIEKLPAENVTVVMDRGYNDYKLFA